MKQQKQIHECMSFMEFKAALRRYFELKKRLSSGNDRFKKLQQCDEILDEISYSFDDEYRNIKRWLCGIRCRYYHPGTGNEIDLEIGNDVEAIYDFLRFIYKLKNHIAIEDEELYELTLEIARSNSTVPWEEC